MRQTETEASMSVILAKYLHFLVLTFILGRRKPSYVLGPEKKTTTEKPSQVRRCAQGHERRHQLGEGENKSWRYDFFFYEFTGSNLCLLFNKIFCSGERSRTQAELAALREARSIQMEEVDPLYSTRQVQCKIV